MLLTAVIIKRLIRSSRTVKPVLNPLLVAAFYGEAVSALSVAGSVIVVFSIIVYNLHLARKNQVPPEKAA